MKTIHKFPLADPKVSIWVPIDAVILHVHEQNGYPCIWVELDGSKPNAERKVFWIGTGWPTAANTKYLGTAHCNGFVWHVFEDLHP